MRPFSLLVACLYAPVLTYTADGQPYWYFIDGQWQGESGQFELVEYRRVNGAATLAQCFPDARIERVAAAPTPCVRRGLIANYRAAYCDFRERFVVF